MVGATGYRGLCDGGGDDFLVAWSLGCSSPVKGGGLAELFGLS